MQSQLASNESSAIIATVDSVEDSALSVFSYSLDKYVPSHAFQKIAIDAINAPRDFVQSKQLIADRVEMDPGSLGDATAALKDLVT